MNKEAKIKEGLTQLNYKPLEAPMVGETLTELISELHQRHHIDQMT